MLRLTRSLLVVALVALSTSASAERVYQEQRPEATEAKFARVERFAEQLPSARRRVTSALQHPQANLETAVATIVRIMDETYIRVGSDRYSHKDQPTFGASSLRKEHVSVEGDVVHFQFRGKSGVSWDRSVKDPALARSVRLFLRRPGARLFEVEGADGRPTPVTERDVREFLRPYGALPKDFRTFHANRLLTETLAASPRPPPGLERELVLKRAIREVAKKLGHTPAVSQRSYLDARRIEAYRGGGANASN